MNAIDNGEVFECIDCGIEVWRPIKTAANDEHLCLECSWLRGIEDPVAREEMRVLLNKE